MTRETLAEPRVVYPPGAHIEELLEEKNMTQAELSARLGLSKKVISEIIRGKAPVTPTTAQHLENVFKVPSHVWINLEGLYANYQEKCKQNQLYQAKIDWAKDFPISELKKHGLITKVRGVTIQTVKEVLQFFSVSDPQQWEAFHKQMMPQLSFRKSSSSDYKSISVWLRWGEIIADQLYPPAYDKAKFKAAIREIRELIKTNDYHDISKKITKLCFDAGVVLLFVPAIKNAKVSGVTRWLSPTKPLIQLSLRYKSDDHFWFTFFHECAHILKHHKKEMYLEFAEKSEKPEVEEEADTYARNLLIPPRAYQSFVQSFPKPNQLQIETFARQVEVPPAVVLGRLQHEGILPFDRFNHLKQKLELISV